jgi:ubiquitin thioesterase ZRANB1
VKSYRGEYFIGLARFQGVYLPLLWETNFCSKSPICLGFTRNHFSALVSMQERINLSSSSSRSSSPLIHNHDTDIQQRPSPTSSPSLINPQQNDNSDTQIFYHPLMDCDGNLLPVHFLTASEVCSIFTRKILSSIFRLDMNKLFFINGLIVVLQVMVY